MTIIIDCDCGRIGEWWWVNSEPSEKIYGGDIIPGLRRTLVRWGTCGYGRNLKVSLEQLND